MNYQFRDAVVQYVANGRTTSTEFWGSLMRVHFGYGSAVSRNMLNLLSSHDTPRFVTLCEGDAKLALLGAGLQFTWVGAPSIYYGEEIGMEGGRDPDNRRGMVWSAATNENPFLQEYRALATLRRLSPALQSGDPSLIEANDADRTLVFRRGDENQQVIVVVNRSNVERNVAFAAPGAKGAQIDLLSNRVVSVEEQSLSIKMPPLSLAVLADDTAESRQIRSHVHRARTGEVSLP
jgi:glycosidase